ncbi:LysR family transcriptional regulator [Fretibacter rubidus]|uniref:LysR family transcriptional regulator n=1 Tax=Fretibacter rubidus TaxID=570162 RepID=UPI00352BC943
MKNWSDYPIFIAVAETGSLTAAGRKLKMSQPTVGRRIRALEDHFGTRLLTKENGALVPTTFGYSILDHVKRMQDEAAAIDRSSATLEHSLAGTVRMSATEGIGTSWLPPVMQAFRRSHPDIMIDLGIGFKNFNLAQREADIALRWMGPGDQNSLIGRKVATVTFGLFASKGYLAERGTPKSLEDLKNHDGVLATIMDDKILWIDDGNGNPVHLPDRITMRTNSIWAFDEAMNAGFGIGATVLCSDCVNNDNMVRVLPNVSRREDLYLVAHEDLRRSTRIRAVFDYLVEAFAQDADMFLNGGLSVFDNGNMVCGTDNDPHHVHRLNTKDAAE